MKQFEKFRAKNNYIYEKKTHKLKYLHDLVSECPSPIVDHILPSLRRAITSSNLKSRYLLPQVE